MLLPKNTHQEAASHHEKVAKSLRTAEYHENGNPEEAKNTQPGRMSILKRPTSHLNQPVRNLNNRSKNS